jgi:hypothetical protein
MADVATDHGGFGVLRLSVDQDIVNARLIATARGRVF